MTIMCPMLNTALRQINVIAGDTAIYHWEFPAPGNSKGATIVAYLNRGLFFMTHCKCKNEPAEASMEAAQFYRDSGGIASLPFHAKCDTITFIRP